MRVENLARRLDLQLLQKSSATNKELRVAASNFSLSDADKWAKEFERLANAYTEIGAAVGNLPETVIAQDVSSALSILAIACQWIHAVLGAEVDAGRFLRAVQAKAKLFVLQSRSTAPTMSPARMALTAWLDSVCAIDDVTMFDPAVASFARLLLPVFYFVGEDPYASIMAVRKEMLARRELAGEGAASQEDVDPTACVVKVLLSVDGTPWGTPQAIRSMVQHEVEARIQVHGWPRDMDLVEVDFLSTQDPQMYAAPHYRWTRAEVKSDEKKRGGLLFKFAQSLQSQPIALATRARFLTSDNLRAAAATVIGHADLQVRALDQSSYPVLTRYPMIDIQIPVVLEDVQKSLPSLRPSDFDDFMNCLVVLGRYAGMVQQTGVFKGKIVDEKRDFQRHLLEHMRMQLGQDVHEEEVLAGGRLDLRFRNVIVELKVERDLKDRDKLRVKYVRQPAQYSASGIPVSVVCVLDMVEKDEPPANVANNITLETPGVHGYTDAVVPQYPSKVAVVIIDGNLRSPSSYS
jgi:hypothetical protein